MDPITHITSGALAGKILRNSHGTKWIYALTILAAWLPDIDNFVGLGPEEYLLYHRGISHSFVGILAQAALLTGVFCLIGKKFKPLKTFLVSLSLLATHLWLDTITTYGTQLLAPFSNYRFQWGSVFIIDLILTLTMLGLFFYSLIKKKRAPAIIGFAFIFIYPIACRSVRNTLDIELPALLAAQNVQFETATVTTDAFSPFYWKAMVDDGERIRVASLCILPTAKDALIFTDFKKADDVLLTSLGEQASFFRTWKWFANYPVMDRHEQDGQPAITFGDVRFYSPNPWLREFFEARSMPFTMTAILAPDGSLDRFLYNHRNKVQAYAVTN